MHGMDHLAFYKDLTTSELINCVTRLTREMDVNPFSPYVRDELESIQAEVNYRLTKIKN